MQHYGYEKNFNCIHKREIYIDPSVNGLIGIDHIFKKSDGIPIRYVFRFHLNPGLSAVKTMSGNSALIQISKNKSVLFTADNENLEIENVYQESIDKLKDDRLKDQQQPFKDLNLENLEGTQESRYEFWWENTIKPIK